MLAATAYYEQFLHSDIARLDIEGAVAAWPELAEAEKYALELYAGTDFPEIGLKETHAKYIGKQQLREQLATLKNNWPQIKARLEKQIIPFAEASRRLRIVGAPTRPEEIGITRRRMKESVIRAQHIRRRFTILDVAVRTNLLGQWTDAIFGPGRGLGDQIIPRPSYSALQKPTRLHRVPYPAQRAGARRQNNLAEFRNIRRTRLAETEKLHNPTTNG